MGQPVVHFEIIGGDPIQLRTYYAELFEWTFQENSPVAPRGGHGFRSHALFYVGVPDVEAALQKAVGLGGKRVLGPARNEAGRWSWATSLTLQTTWLVSPGRSDDANQAWGARGGGVERVGERSVEYVTTRGLSRGAGRLA